MVLGLSYEYCKRSLSSKPITRSAGRTGRVRDFRLQRELSIIKQFRPHNQTPSTRSLPNRNSS